MVSDAEPAKKKQPKEIPLKIERRADPRVKIEVRGKIKFVGGPSWTKKLQLLDFWTFTSDLSAGGARIFLPFEVRPGEKVEIELVLPRVRRMIKAQAEIKWQKKGAASDLLETGLQFRKISPEDKIFLLEFLYLNHKAKKQAKGGKK